MAVSLGLIVINILVILQSLCYYGVLPMHGVYFNLHWVLNIIGGECSKWGIIWSAVAIAMLIVSVVSKKYLSKKDMITGYVISLVFLFGSIL